MNQEMVWIGVALYTVLGFITSVWYIIKKYQGTSDPPPLMVFFLWWLVLFIYFFQYLNNKLLDFGEWLSIILEKRKENNAK